MERDVDLLERARQCRRLARQSTDARTIAILIDTAESYEREAGLARRATTAPPSAAAAATQDPATAP